MALLRPAVLLQSGCQQWSRQSAAVHGDKFCFASSLAIYWHSAEDQCLLKVFAHPSSQLSAICCSPADPDLVAFATADQHLKVFHVPSESVNHGLDIPLKDDVTHLSWATHHDSVLLLTAGNVLATWAYTAATWRTLLTCASAITCFQQSASSPRLAALGCEDGSLMLLDLVAAKVACTVRPAAACAPCDVAFDPLSQQYLLVACSGGQLVLYAIDQDYQLSQVSALAKQPAAQRRIAFMPTAPGSFVTISDKSGALQVWNVSQLQPLRTLSTGQGPAQSISFFAGSSKAVITFQDGMVMLYDVAAAQPRWRSEAGHTETIFHCCWALHDPNLLATCSYDGSVRVWDVSSNRCKHILTTGAAGVGPASGAPATARTSAPVLYSCCWSPDGSQLAASSAAGDVYLYEVAKGTAVKTWRLHNKSALHVSWSPLEEDLLVSSSLDGTAVVFYVDGTRVKVLRHKQGVSCCAWHPSRPLYLATTSVGGRVLVWDIDTREVEEVEGGSGSSRLKTLEGHSGRSFSVSWSPLVPQLLLSGADDGTARVWDVDAGCCLAVLTGHSSRVRALAWHPELPWLVFTGSWDSSIRCWDWPRARGLLVCRQHHADVYGLDIHPARPWLMASASRDTTIRLWDLAPWLAAPLWAAGLAGELLPLGEAEQVLQLSSPAPILCGAASKALAEELGALQQRSSSPRQLQQQRRSSDSTELHASSLVGSSATRQPRCALQRAALLSQYFGLPGAPQVLWALAEVVAAQRQGDPLRRTRSHPTPGSCLAAPLSRVSLADAKRCDAECSSQLEVGPSRPPAATGTSAAAEAAERGSLLSGAALRSAQEAVSCGEAARLHHWSRVAGSLRSEAAGHQLAAGQARGLAASRKAAALEQAAQCYLLAGDLEQACQLLAEVQQWDKALALAPAVSQAFWLQMLHKRADALAREGAAPRELLPLLLAGGPASSCALVQQLQTSGDHGLAADIAASRASGVYQHWSTYGPSHQVCPSPSMRRAPSGRTSLAPPLSPSCSMNPGGALLPDKAPTLAPAPGGRLTRAGLLPSISMPRDRTSSGGGSILAFSPLASPNGSSPQQDWPTPCSNPQLLQQQPDATAGSADSDTALVQLQQIRAEQAYRFRAAGRGVLAACCLLTVDDVTGTAEALLGGHEPEQALGLLLGLGEQAPGHQALLRQAVAAVAQRCEVSGQWAAAAAAFQLLPDPVERQAAVQLLVVRAEGIAAERQAKAAAPGDSAQSQAAMDTAIATAAASEAATTAAIAAAGGPAVGALTVRRHLGIPDAAACQLSRGPPANAASSSVVDATAHARWQLLCGKFPEAAKAVVSAIHALAAQLPSHGSSSRFLPELSCGQPPHMSSSDTVGPGMFGPSTPPRLLAPLVAWQEVGTSLRPAQVDPGVWSQLVACDLLVAGLRAFDLGYHTVGQYLLSRLRHWLECASPAVPDFPLSRPALRLLEAERLVPAEPAAAAELLSSIMTAADSREDIKRVAELMLARLPGGGAPGRVAAARGVVVSGSGLPSAAAGGPSNPAGSIIPRSNSGACCGMWMVLEDGISNVTFNEAVMLTHVMRCSPLGTGQYLLV